MKLKEVAHLLGPGPKMFFAVDTESMPDKMIFHFVQFTTVHLPKGDPSIDNHEFKSVHNENDPRLQLFAENCINDGTKIRKHKNKHHRT